jgi:hypothetical protein
LASPTSGLLYPEAVGGTSSATSSVSAAIALLSDLRVGLTGTAALEALVDSSRSPGTTASAFHLERAARSLGLDAIVDDARRRQQQWTSGALPSGAAGDRAPAPPDSTQKLLTDRPRSQLRVDRVLAAKAAGELLVGVHRRVPCSRLKVALLRRRGEFGTVVHRQRITTASYVRFKRVRRVDAVRVQLLPARLSTSLPSQPIQVPLADAISAAKRLQWRTRKQSRPSSAPLPQECSCWASALPGPLGRARTS